MDSRKAKITIRSIVKAGDGEEEVSVFTYEGVCREVNGFLHILFGAEDDGGDVKTHIVVRRECLEVRRHGAVEAAMVFQPGIVTESRYRTEYGTIPIRIRTREYRQEQGNAAVILRLYYDLLQDNTVLTENQVEIEIKPSG